MTPDQIKALKIHYVQLNEYYQRPPLSDATIGMYADDLQGHSFEVVMAALVKYRKNPKNKITPLPSMVLDLIRPEIDTDTQAISTAARVYEAVSKFGWNNAQDARAYVGELGWAGVNRFGGWTQICENLGRSIQPSSFQAQLREILKSEIKLGAAGGYEALPYHSREQIGDVKQLLSMVKEIK